MKRHIDTGAAMKTVSLLLLGALLTGCAWFEGEPGQHESIAVLVWCNPLTNGGHVPQDGGGRTCEQDVAEQYPDYARDLEEATKP